MEEHNKSLKRKLSVSTSIEELDTDRVGENLSNGPIETMSPPPICYGTVT